MTKEEFWSKIEITEEEKKQSIHFLKYRGIDEHDHVRQYLESLTGRKVFYSEIATTFRYDKRIRRVLYKYIGLLEESIRAYIANKYNNSTNTIKHTSKVSRLLKESNSLYTTLSELTFGELISQAIRLTKSDKKQLFEKYLEKEDNYQHLSKDLYAIVELRNEISHNRFLLNNKRLKSCSVGDGNCTLWANAVNLYEILPIPFNISFVDEIINCSRKDLRSKKYHSNWSLISEIVITIKLNNQ